LACTTRAYPTSERTNEQTTKRENQLKKKKAAGATDRRVDNSHWVDFEREDEGKQEKGLAFDLHFFMREDRESNDEAAADS